MSKKTKQPKPQAPEMAPAPEAPEAPAPEAQAPQPPAEPQAPAPEEAPEMKALREEAEALKARLAQIQAQLPAPKHLQKSSVESPVQKVFEICRSMPGARRKDVIEACVAAGIAFYTARTQYQNWYKASKGE